MNLKDAYNYSVSFLEENKIDETDFKALCLVCHLDKIKNSEFPFHRSDNIDTAELERILSRLKTGEPLQYVLGKWDFYESEFYVGKGVLIPRPETEELVDRVIKYAEGLSNPVIIDLCSGSGCIGLSIAKKLKTSKVYCIEKSADAFEYLKKNAEGINNAVIINDDIFNNIDIPQADIIVSNPPYIKSADIAALQKEVLFEPEMALDGGEDGLIFYRLINDKWSFKLKKDGALFLEIGNEQGISIKCVLSAFNSVEVIKDIYKNDRIVIAKSID